MAEDNPSPPAGLQLGTFLGVFTPTVLTILGVILYLRLGWVVANAGVWGTLAIVVLANAITLITALSLSALATNMRVGVGGAYYIISRSLGLEVGGALGIPLYLSQTLSLTLYAFGLAESVRIVAPGAPVQPLAAVIVVAVVLVASRSTSFALKLQVPIMALIGLSLAALFLGTGFEPAEVAPMGDWADTGFWGVFAVFFPAVTGILAGVSLSGDLTDPGRSIPVGSLLAVGVGSLVYLVTPLALAGAAGADALRDPLIWTKLAFAGAFLVMPGLWGAIFSSAIGSILSAPRTLQALANDSLASARFSKVDPKTGEPMFALYVSGAVALGAVALGDLNAVATVVSMFFLTTYGMLNLAAGLERLVADPSYRPRIRIPWWVSFLGAAGCFVAMFAISPGALAIAVIVEGALWWYLRRRALKTAWGDLRTGFWFALARMAMLKLRSAHHDPRNWRPHILVFTTDVARSVGMVRMASRFSQDHGIVTVTTLWVGDTEDHEDIGEQIDANRTLLRAHGVAAFSEVVCVPDLDSGIMSIAQANGFGGLSSNMVMFGWPRQGVDGLANVLGHVRRLAALEKSAMIMRPGPRPDQNDGPRARRIVVWWKGRHSNGDLMLLLAHLLTSSDHWRTARIELKSVVDDESLVAPIQGELASLLGDGRIAAHVEVLVRSPDQAVAGVIRGASAGADLVFLGLAAPPTGQERAYAEGLMRLMEDLPNTILVRNAGPFRGRLV